METVLGITAIVMVSILTIFATIVAIKNYIWELRQDAFNKGYELGKTDKGE